ncbi:MAG: hypothetical protein WC516_05935 [Patescibacteria group bacterium]|jgi:mannose-6-phosphate isomerase-like protein (cupin superfamily)
MKSLKIWGIVNNLYTSEQCKIDHLYIRENTACSLHYHKKKFNRFILLKGNVHILTDLGDYQLKLDEPFDIDPTIIHQFKAFKNSFIIEISFVKEGVLDDLDIIRLKQGGEFINGKFFTLDELKNQNLKAYNDYE